MIEGPVELDRLFQLPVRCPRLKQFSVDTWYCVKLDLLYWTLSERQHGEGKASRKFLT